MSTDIKHLYIHIPFCKNKCPYCDFFSVPHVNDETKSSYISAILKELDYVSEIISPGLKTLYFGGGSPIIVGLNNLNKIFNHLKNHINNNTEVSIEVNPEHLETQSDKLILNHIRDLGINRISIGVQTTNKDLLKKIKRKYNLNSLRENIIKVKKLKFNLSLDFMFGLPNQTLDNLKEDLAFIKEDKPNHVSFYLFTPPKGYKYTEESASEHLAEKMFYLTHSFLEELGYEHYEISNYSLNNDVCIHNMAYWERKSYLGLGTAAHSFISEKRQRMWHSKNIEEYIKDPKTYDETEIIDKKTKLNEQIMLGLRLLKKGVPVALLNNKNYMELVQKGFVAIKDNALVITPKGIPLLDSLTSGLL